ncbi:MAG: molecular chaperone DnaK, partial [Actinobacteria bacterium]
EAETRNGAEQLVYQTEKFLADNADKVPAEAKANVDEPLAELKKALEGTDVAAIKTAVEKVATASQALGAALYQQQASAPTDQPGGDQPAGEEDVVDAEIIDEDEQK